MIIITQLIYIIEGQEKTFDEFEKIVIPLILNYNGQLLLRIRPTENNFIETSIKKPYEIHIIEFATENDFEKFKHDKTRNKFLYLKNNSIEEVILIQGKKI